eukprot:TRINITY_DN20016_c0_g1_i1.p1 TRINITY_DN20016_c0_g1~~TRINITY_DN20016_c0_g1_i1.p1  ORF type:complete len:241 (-),score=23.46 TRINITY_DN20016_c0_g1_i1:26-718(-)
MGFEYFSKQRIDEAGKIGVRIQKLVFAEFIIRAVILICFAIVGAEIIMSMIFSSTIDVVLALLVFFGAKLRNKGLLNIFYIVQIVIWVLSVVVGILFMVIFGIVIAAVVSSTNSHKREVSSDGAHQVIESILLMTGAALFISLFIIRIIEVVLAVSMRKALLRCESLPLTTPMEHKLCDGSSPMIHNYNVATYAGVQPMAHDVPIYSGGVPINHQPGQPVVYYPLEKNVK